jgi:ribosomal protein L9
MFGTQEMSNVKKLREQLDPADFDLIGEYYLGDNEDMADCYSHALPPSFDHELTGKCEHCGTHHLYGAAFRDRNDGSVIAVGRNCAENFFNFSSKMDAAIARAKKLTTARKQREEAAAKAAGFLADKPELVADLEADHYIVSDIKAKLTRYGSISEKQVALVHKIAADVRRREEERANEPEPQPIPAELLDGRHEIEGVILGFKEYETQWGWNTKMIVADKRGFKVFGSCPDNDGSYGRGDTVAFMARVEKSKDDECFGFYSRPTKCRIVEKKEE